MKQIETEVLQAYADAHGNESFEITMHKRSLMFKASAPVTRDEAVEIMAKAAPAYNEFSAGKLALLPPGSMVTLAREFSVCVYVTPPVREIKKMHADEWHQQEDGSTRIWWD